jgi:hypothetical protein
MPTKDRQHGAFLALDTLAGMATARAGGRPASKRAYAFRKGDAPKHLSEDEVLVIVASRGQYVVEKVRLGSRQPSASDVALCFVEIDEAVSQALDADPLPTQEATAPGLSEAEKELLERGGFSVAPMAPDEESPRLRATVDYAKLLEDSFTSDEAAKKLKVNPSRIRQRLAARELYGIKDRRGWRVPKFQFSGSRLVPQIDEVLPRVPGDLHPLAVYRWFTTPNPDLVDPAAVNLEVVGKVNEEVALPLSPLEWLRRGLPVDQVVELASQL